MIIIRKRAYARAGLVGNPSDGYHGKTISISVRNFWAEVVLYEWDSVDIVLAEDDRARFSSVYDLARDPARQQAALETELHDPPLYIQVQGCDTKRGRGFWIGAPRRVGPAVGGHPGRDGFPRRE